MADSTEHVDRPLTPLFAALWTMALWLLQGIAEEVTEAVRAGALRDVVDYGACTVLATSVVLFGMVRVHARDVSLRATLGLRGIALLHVVLAAAAGAGLYPLMSAVDARILRRWPYDDAENSALHSFLDMPTARARVALVVVMYLIVPLATELFFRGILLGGLRRAVGPRVAIGATAILCACCSSDWRAMPTVLVLSLAFARVRDRTGTVLAPIVATLAFGAVEAVPVIRGGDPLADLTFSPRWIVGGAVIAVLALVGIGAGRDEDRE